MKKILITVLLGLLLCGCATTKLPWPSSKQTPAQINAGIAECTQIIEKQPMNADAYRCRGELYQQKKEFNMAIPDFKKAVDLAPNDVNAIFTLAWAYREMRDYREAYFMLVKLIVTGKANNDVVGAVLNDTIRKMSIEDELALKEQKRMIRYAPKKNANILLEQWKTIERIQSLLQAKQYEDVPMCWSKGKYRVYIEQKLKKDAEGFSKEWFQSIDKFNSFESFKQNFINGKVPVSFIKENGEWKMDEL